MDIAHLNCINLVRRAQRAISRDFLCDNLSQFTARDSFLDSAHLVVENYFPRAVHRGNTANISDLVEMYVHAFVLAPLQYRIPGVFRPDWAHGTTLSWFRRCLGENTGQWRWCEPVVDIDRSPAAVLNTFTSVVNIRDTTFSKTAAAVMCNLASSEGRKAKATQLFLDPFAAGAFDRHIDEVFHVRASGPVRSKLRAQKRNVASYLRIGSYAILLADIDTATRTESAAYRWRDIREEPIRWQGYVIEWNRKESKLRVRLEHQVLAAAIREIKGILESRSNQKFKLDGVVHKAETFLHAHRYATGSLEELREFNRRVHQLVSKHVTANDPALVYTNGKVGVYDKIVLPITNPFISLSTDQDARRRKGPVISNETWMHFWNPYRTTNSWAHGE